MGKNQAQENSIWGQAEVAITDAKGNESSYSYGDAAGMLRLASLTSDGTGTVSYAYDTNGKLTDISRGSFSVAYICPFISTFATDE